MQADIEQLRADHEKLKAQFLALSATTMALGKALATVPGMAVPLHVQLVSFGLALEDSTAHPQSTENAFEIATETADMFRNAILEGAR